MANNRLRHEIFGDIDLHKPGLGSGIPNLWQHLLSDKRSPVEKRQLLCLYCLEDFGERVPMWVKERQRDGLKIGVHKYGDAERLHTPPESPEHKALKERVYRTATQAGFDATVEQWSADKSIRSDVLIRGAAGVLGWEVQRTEKSPPSIGRRDAHARRNGVIVAWHTDNIAFAKHNEVAWLRTHVMPPEVILKQAVLPVGGVTRIRWERCDRRRAKPCPTKRYGRCGKFHPELEADRADLDYVVRSAAAGDIVRIILKGSSRNRKLWVPAEDRRRCQDAGLLIPEQDTPRPANGNASRRAPTCAERQDRRRDERALTSPREGESGCNWNRCGRPGRPFPCGIRCERHTPRALRGLPEIPPGPGWARDRQGGAA